MGRKDKGRGEGRAEERREGKGGEGKKGEEEERGKGCAMAVGGMDAPESDRPELNTNAQLNK